jgi:hypothetical protein
MGSGDLACLGLRSRSPGAFFMLSFWRVHRAHLLPFRLQAFFDAMSARILLQRAGVHYRFIHRSLQEHFASLTPADIDTLAQEIEATKSCPLTPNFPALLSWPKIRIRQKMCHIGE